MLKIKKEDTSPSIKTCALFQTGDIRRKLSTKFTDKQTFTVTLILLLLLLLYYYFENG